MGRFAGLVARAIKPSDGCLQFNAGGRRLTFLAVVREDQAAGDASAGVGLKHMAQQQERAILFEVSSHIPGRRIRGPCEAHRSYYSRNFHSLDGQVLRERALWHVDDYIILNGAALVRGHRNWQRAGQRYCSL